MVRKPLKPITEPPPVWTTSSIHCDLNASFSCRCARYVEYFKIGKITICWTTLHTSNQLLFTFTDLWTIADVQVYLPLWAMASCKLHGSICSLNSFNFAIFAQKLIEMAIYTLTTTILVVFKFDFKIQGATVVYSLSGLGTVVLTSYFMATNSKLSVVVDKLEQVGQLHSMCGCEHTHIR